MNNTSYLLLSLFVSAPLCAMNEKNGQEYAKKLLDETSIKVLYVDRIENQQEKDKAWIDILIQVGKIEACKDLGFFGNEEIEHVDKGYQNLQEAWLFHINSERKRAVLTGLLPLFVLKQAGAFDLDTKMDEEAFKDLLEKLKI